MFFFYSPLTVMVKQCKAKASSLQNKKISYNNYMTPPTKKKGSEVMNLIESVKKVAVSKI